MVDNFYVTFGDPSCDSLQNIILITRQTERQTNASYLWLMTLTFTLLTQNKWDFRTHNGTFQ